MEKDDYKREWETCIGGLLSKRNGCLSESLRLTEEMKEALDRNDRVAAQTIMEFRAGEINSLTKIQEELHVLMQSFSEQDAEKTKLVFMGQLDGLQLSPHIESLAKNGAYLLKKIVQLDRRINQNIAGEQSYYNQEGKK